MKPKTAILLVLLLAFAAVMIAITKWTASPEPAPAGPKDLWPAPPEQIVGLRIQPAAGQTLRFERMEGTWRLAEPTDARVQQRNVEQLLETLASLQYVRAFDPADTTEGLGDDVTGLDRPGWTVTLKTADGQERSLQVGRRVAPIGTARGETEVYVRPEGRTQTFVVQRNLPQLLARDAADYQRRKLLDLDRNDVVRLDLRGRQSYTLLRTGTKWKMELPQPVRADTQAVNDLLGKLARLTAKRIVATRPESLPPWGLDQPRLSLTVTTETAIPQTQPSTAPAGREIHKHTLRIGSQRDGEIFAARDGAPTVYALDASMLEDLAPPAEKLRSNVVLDIDTDSLQSLAIDHAGVKTQLQRSEGTWRMMAPQAGPARQASVEDLLESLAGLRAESWLTPKTAGLEITDPRATLTLQPEGEAEPILLRVGSPSPSGKMVYLQVAGQPGLAAVEIDQTQALLRPAAYYWPRGLLDLPRKARIESLSIDRPDGGHVLARGQERQWLLAAPISAEADDEQLDKITAMLRNLRAGQIVTLDRAAPDELNSASERIVVELTLAEPAPTTAPATAPATQSAETRPATRTIRLVVVRNREGTYAWRPDAEPVAVGKVPANLYDALAAELRDRDVWSIDPEEVTAVELSGSLNAWTLDRREDGWACPEDPALTIYAEQVKTFLDELKTVRALDFVSYDSADEDRYDLASPAMLLKLTFRDGSTKELRLSGEGPPEAPGRYATTRGVEGVFVAPARVAKLLDRKVTIFAEKPAPKPDPAMPGGFGPAGPIPPVRPR